MEKFLLSLYLLTVTSTMYSLPQQAPPSMPTSTPIPYTDQSLITKAFYNQQKQTMYYEIVPLVLFHTNHGFLSIQPILSFHTVTRDKKLQAQVSYFPLIKTQQDPFIMMNHLQIAINTSLINIPLITLVKPSPAQISSIQNIPIDKKTDKKNSATNILSPISEISYMHFFHEDITNIITSLQSIGPSLLEVDNVRSFPEVSTNGSYPYYISSYSIEQIQMHYNKNYQKKSITIPSIPLKATKRNSIAEEDYLFIIKGDNQSVPFSIIPYYRQIFGQVLRLYVSL